MVTNLNPLWVCLMGGIYANYSAAVLLEYHGLKVSHNDKHEALFLQTRIRLVLNALRLVGNYRTHFFCPKFLY